MLKPFVSGSGLLVWLWWWCQLVTMCEDARCCPGGDNRCGCTMAGPTGCGGLWGGNPCFPVLMDDGSWRCGGTKAKGHRQLIGTVAVLGCKPCDSALRPSVYREMAAWNDAKIAAAAEAARKATNPMAAACGPCWQDNKGGSAAGSWQTTTAGGWQNKAASGWKSSPWNPQNHGLPELLERIEILETDKHHHEQERVDLLERIVCLEQGNHHHEQDLVTLMERIGALEKYVGETCQRIVKSEKEIEANKHEIEANKKEIEANKKDIEASKNEIEANMKDIVAVGNAITTTKEIEANKKEIEANKQSLHNKPPGLPEPPEDFELLVTSDPDAVASTTGAPS